MNKYKELVNNIGLFAIGNFSSKILIFLLVPIYTRILSTDEYGFYDLSYTTIQLLFPILTLGITEAIMRFLMIDGIQKKDVLTIALRHLSIGNIAFGSLLLINYIFHINHGIDSYAIFIFLFFFFYCLYNALIQFAKGIGQVKVMTEAGIIGAFCMIIFNLMFLIVLKLKLKGYFIANLFGYVIPCCYIIFHLKLWKYVNKRINKELNKEMLSFSIPLIANTLGWWVNNTSDRYIITAICGIENNGLLSVAYKIPSVITTIGTVFIQAWQISAIKEKDKKAKNEFYSNLFFCLNGVMCICASLLIILVKPVAKIMFGKDFYYAWSLVPFLIISSVFNTSAGFIGAILAAEMNSRAMAKSAFAGIVINITMNISLALVIGPQGITIASMISSFIIYKIRKKSCINNWGGKKYKNVIISWILLIVISIFVINTKNYVFQILFFFSMVILYFDLLKIGLKYIKSKYYFGNK